MIRAGVIAVLLAAGGGAAAVAASPPDTGSGVQWFAGSLEQARARAKSEKKIVVLDAWAKWCAPCRVMEREVWSRDDLARALEREAVPFRAEVDRFAHVGIELGDRYGIQALPQILYLDPASGDVVERLEGSQTPDTILSVLDRARAKVASAEQVEAAGTDPAALVRLGSRLMRSERPKEARDALQRAIRLDADCHLDQAADAALLLAEMDDHSGQPQAALATLEQAAARCPKSARTAEIWKTMVDVAPRAGGAVAEERVLRARADTFSGDADAQQALAEFLVRAGKDLPAAEKAAARAVGLAPDDPRALGTLARVRLAQGRRDDAQKLVDQALKIDPHDTDLRELRLKITLGR